MIKGLHHVGFEVENLEDSIKHYESLGFKVAGRFEYVEADFKGAILSASGFGNVELFQFDNHDHEMAEKVKHHSAFETDDLESDLKSFLDKGYEIAIPLKNGKIVKRYVYLKDKYDNYIELLEA